MEKSLKEIYEKSNMKCIADGNEYNSSDKGTNHTYIDVYEELLKPYINKKINFLEIGVNGGYSMMMWSEYFTEATLFGIDYQDIAHHREGYEYIISDINNEKYLEGIIGDIKFDIIIDDGSHIIDDQINTLKYLYPKLKEGGLYVVEDVNDLDNVRELFNEYNLEIYDNRLEKNRWDDVLIIIKK